MLWFFRFSQSPTIVICSTPQLKRYRHKVKLETAPESGIAFVTSSLLDSITIVSNAFADLFSPINCVIDSVRYAIDNFFKEAWACSWRCFHTRARALQKRQVLPAAISWGAFSICITYCHVAEN
jgi:hypothetical protein